MAEYGPGFPATPLLAMPPVIAGLFTFAASSPMARKTPVEDRKNFWSYKEANKPIWMIAAIVAFGWISYLLGL